MQSNKQQHWIKCCRCSCHSQIRTTLSTIMNGFEVTGCTYWELKTLYCTYIDFVIALYFVLTYIKCLCSEYQGHFYNFCGHCNPQYWLQLLKFHSLLRITLHKLSYMIMIYNHYIICIQYSRTWPAYYTSQPLCQI